MSDDHNDDDRRPEPSRAEGDNRADDDDRSRARKDPPREDRPVNRYQEDRARRAREATGSRQGEDRIEETRNRRPDATRTQAPARSALREDMVQNAIKFLTHPSVRNSSSDKQVTFLRDHKHLTQDEIIEAYNRCNLPVPAFPPASTASSALSPARTDNYRPPSKDVYDVMPPSRPPLPPPPQYAYPPPGSYYPPPPYGAYPPPQAPVPPPPGYGLRALVLTGAASAGLVLGAAYLTKNYIVPRLSPISVTPEKRELPEPPAVDEVIKQRSAKMKEELLQEMQKSAKEQSTATTDAISSLKTLLQQTLEKKDSDLADLKAEVGTLKTRMRDMQMTSAYKPPAPSTSLPAWQREPQKPIGANKWSINEPSSSTPAAASSTPASSSSHLFPSSAPSTAPVPSATQTLVSTGGTTPISTSPVRPSSPTGPNGAATHVVPAASPAAPAAATPTKNPGERPLSFQTVMDMVARGETPPDVRQDIDDKPISAAGGFAPKGSREVPPKPYAHAPVAPSEWAAVRDTPAAAAEPKDAASS